MNFQSVIKHFFDLLNTYTEKESLKAWSTQSEKKNAKNIKLCNR